MGWWARPAASACHCTAALRQGAQCWCQRADAAALDEFVQAHPAARHGHAGRDRRYPGRAPRASSHLGQESHGPRGVLRRALPRQPRQGGDLDDWLRHNQVSYGALHLLHAVLPHLLAQPYERRRGHISLMASVAGYRGLPTAWPYGPPKAALINLAGRCTPNCAAGVGVSVVNPGFVETPLTAQNRFAMPALINSETAARACCAAGRAARSRSTSPGAFTWGMKLLRWLPDAAFFCAHAAFDGLTPPSDSQSKSPASPVPFTLFHRSTMTTDELNRDPSALNDTRRRRGTAGECTGQLFQLTWQLAQALTGDVARSTARYEGPVQWPVRGHRNLVTSEPCSST